MDIRDTLKAQDPMASLDDATRAAVEALSDMAVNQEHKKLLVERRKRRALESELAAAWQRYDDVLQIKSGAAARPSLPKILSSVKVTSPAAAVLLWSDWHIDSHITRANTQDQNEFTVEIAWERVHALVQRSIWQLRAWDKVSGLDTVVVAALGDWIAGDIHSELVETSMAPEEATRIVREMHQWALEQLHKLKFLKRIVYVGMCDNHARATHKNQWVNGHERSYNWGMYHALQAVCEAQGLEKIEFVIPRGSIQHVDIMGHNFRMMHGHQMGANPGLAGQRGMNWIKKANVGAPADYTLVGHFHTARDHGALVVNGSLCGPDAYSTQNGFVSEKAVQLMLLVRPSLGVCDTSRIFPDPEDQ